MLFFLFYELKRKKGLFVSIKKEKVTTTEQRVEWKKSLLWKKKIGPIKRILWVANQKSGII